MTSLDPNTLRKPSQLLPIVGIILILTFAVDFMIRLFTQQWDQPETQITLLNEVIDRGIIPLIGLALAYAGFWINDLLRSPNPEAESASPWGSGQFWVFVFASLMGLVFLLLIPLHFSTSGEILSSAVSQIEQQEAQAKFVIQQEQQQVQSILDSGQLEALLQNNNLPEEQRKTFEELQKDPQSLETKVAERLKEVQDKKTTEVDKLNKDLTVTRWRAEVRSFLLFLGFIAIGWNGLRDAR